MKTMIITGSSRGIGAATALLAAKNDFSVVVNYLKHKIDAEKVVRDIVDAGGKAVAIQADISKEGDVLRLFSETDRLFGNLHSLINNAGILERQMRLENIGISRLNRIFSANITGQFLCAREAVKRMSTRHGGKGGTIVNVSSLAAKTGAPGEYIDYAVSKGALDTLTIGLSKEVADEGIRVNGVRPAFIYTDIHADGGEYDRVNRIKESIPMKRGGTAHEVAEAIIWLASEKSSFSTGTFIDITGGS
ncbi:SDR family oxidoreductase [Arenibacter algicola]|uniref:SDR family oxidoreductase n=1 Tax=Arenibacter algicola TaxID=616991 RepID=UPI001C067FB9|nr:SDR family oxidoreductase [Arenibacter algicola]MBU2905870.1 SDR family oxidoreductase [Arenibacter algicola]